MDRSETIIFQSLNVIPIESDGLSLTVTQSRITHRESAKYNNIKWLLQDEGHALKVITDNRTKGLWSITFLEMSSQNRIVTLMIFLFYFPKRKKEDFDDELYSKNLSIPLTRDDPYIIANSQKLVLAIFLSKLSKFISGWRKPVK